MRIDHRLGDGETEAETAEAACDRALPLLEGIKNLVDLFLLDPDASIRDSDFDFFWSRIKRFNGDTAAGRRKFDAVLDEIPKDLLQTSWISLDVIVFGAEAKFYFEFFTGDVFPTNFASSLEDFRHTNNLKT